jgi:hypothetical protein
MDSLSIIPLTIPVFAAAPRKENSIYRKNVNISYCVTIKAWYCSVCQALRRLFFEILQWDGKTSPPSLRAASAS